MSISGFSYPSPLSPAIRKDNGRMMALAAKVLNMDPSPLWGGVAALSRDLGCSLGEAFAHRIALLGGLDPQGADRGFFQSHVLPSVEECALDGFTKDPYLSLLRGARGSFGSAALTELCLPPFHPFVARELSVTPEGRLLPCMGFFSQPFYYPAVTENGREWMTLLPIEQSTMREPIRRARGRVLTLGLGLGYYVYHVLQKEEVESVTAVECNPDAIALFEACILPRIPHREKLRIVLGDGVAYAAKYASAEHYDCVFSDIWHDAGDGRDLYLTLLRHDVKEEGVDFSYWLEDTILCYLDRELWP